VISERRVSSLGASLAVQDHGGDGDDRLNARHLPWLQDPTAFDGLLAGFYG